jgi:restriction system protein
VFRLVSGGLALVAVALLGAAAMALEWPWWTGAAVLALWWIGRSARLKDQRRILELDLASMSPIEYEQHCMELLRAAGWSVAHIGRQGDQGVDVVAELRGTRAAIQCKKYTRPAGNGAVQEIVAGKRHYGCAIAVIACPAGYTAAARSLAASNAVLLLSHADLHALEQLARVP